MIALLFTKRGGDIATKSGIPATLQENTKRIELPIAQ